MNVDYNAQSINKALKSIDSQKVQITATDFGQGNSTALFLNFIRNSDIWKINHQKQFRDI
jgi:UDP-N-acetylglucosamine 2-epimerase (hydrolysing)